MYAVILAGGTGERFWPWSRRNRPKQFLPLMGSASVLQLAVDRLSGFVESDHIYVVTRSQFVDLVHEQAPSIPWRNIIAEPVGRDTAAAIGLCAEHIIKRNPTGVMVILPADQYIADIDAFHGQLRAAVEVAAGGEWVVTLGIKPSRPETGFGYIKKGLFFGVSAGQAVYRSESFHEKPGIELALQYLNDGNYLWNSGIFIWRADLLRSMIAAYLPDLDAGLQKIAAAIDSPAECDAVREVYQNIPPLSIDFGILEKTDKVLVMPASFGWDDVGTWTSLEKYQEADQYGNVIQAKGVYLDTEQCTVYAPHRVIALLGVKDLLIVDDVDSLMICAKDKSQEIKNIVKALENEGYDDLI